MSAKLRISGNVLKSVLIDIAALIPSGTKSIPLGVCCHNGYLYITCTGVCNYETKIKVDSVEDSVMTVMYTPSHDLLEREETVELEMQPRGVSLECQTLTKFYNLAYSLVNRLDYKDVPLRPIEGSGSFARLRTLTKTQLPSLYKNVPPISIYNGTSILKYPNIWIQTRMPGFPCNCVMTQDCVRILATFNPTHYAVYSEDTIVFSRRESRLFVPVKMCDYIPLIGSLLNGEARSVILGLGTFPDKLRQLKLLECKRVYLTLLDGGITVHGDYTDGSTTLVLGDKEGDFISSCQLPTELLMVCFGLFANSRCEIFYKDGILCLRNQDTALAVHAL